MTAIKYAAKVKESFALPEVCFNVRQMLDNPQTDSEDIANLIALDPSLCSKLLKLANSTLFRFPGQIDSISKAINIIGGEALYILIVSETAASTCRHLSNDVIDLKRFWNQSVLCGMLAQQLCRDCGVRGSERFFLMGLLNNLAELVVAKHSPDLARHCQAEIADVFPWLSQQKHLGFFYADCTTHILKDWQLPTHIYQPLQYIHNADLATSDKEIAVLYLAYRVALKAALPDEFKTRNPIAGRVMDAMGLLYEDLDGMTVQAQLKANAVLRLLNPNS